MSETISEPAAMKTDGLKSIQETTKLLVTLLTALIGFTVTFAGKFAPGTVDFSIGPLVIGSWVASGVSVLMAVWTLLAVAGTMLQIDKGGSLSNPEMTNIKIPFFLIWSHS